MCLDLGFVVFERMMVETDNHRRRGKEARKRKLGFARDCAHVQPYPVDQFWDLNMNVKILIDRFHSNKDLPIQDRNRNPQI